jgi:hypothetical protein
VSVLQRHAEPGAAADPASEVVSRVQLPVAGLLSWFVRPLGVDVHGNHLRAVADTLQRSGFALHERGEGRARCVYALHAALTMGFYWDCLDVTSELFDRPGEGVAAERVPLRALCPNALDGGAHSDAARR